VRTFLTNAVETVKQRINMASVAPVVQAGTGYVVKSGFVTITIGTDTGCVPITGIIKVQLGACAQQADLVHPEYAPTYSMNYVKRGTGSKDQLLQDTYSDAACTQAVSSGYLLAALKGGCGKLHADTSGSPGGAGYSVLDYLLANIGGQTINAYATVSYDAGFDALPAASSISTWYAVATYANADACANPTTNAPIFFTATYRAAIYNCDPTQVAAPCTETYYFGTEATQTVYSQLASYACINVTPQTTGHMMVTQYTGDQQQVRDALRGLTQAPPVTCLVNTTPCLVFFVASAWGGPSPTSLWW